MHFITKRLAIATLFCLPSLGAPVSTRGMTQALETREPTGQLFYTRGCTLGLGSCFGKLAKSKDRTTNVHVTPDDAASPPTVPLSQKYGEKWREVNAQNVEAEIREIARKHNFSEADAGVMRKLVCPFGESDEHAACTSTTTTVRPTLSIAELRALLEKDPDLNKKSFLQKLKGLLKRNTVSKDHAAGATTAPKSRRQKVKALFKPEPQDVWKPGPTPKTIPQRVKDFFKPGKDEPRHAAATATAPTTISEKVKNKLSFNKKPSDEQAAVGTATETKTHRRKRDMFFKKKSNDEHASSSSLPR